MVSNRYRRSYFMSHPLLSHFVDGTLANHVFYKDYLLFAFSWHKRTERNVWKSDGENWPRRIDRESLLELLVRSTTHREGTSNHNRDQIRNAILIGRFSSSEFQRLCSGVGAAPVLFAYFSDGWSCSLEQVHAAHSHQAGLRVTAYGKYRAELLLERLHMSMYV